MLTLVLQWVSALTFAHGNPVYIHIASCEAQCARSAAGNKQTVRFQ